MGEWWSTECTRQAFAFIDVNLLEKNFWMERMVVLVFKRKLQANHVLFPIFSIAGSKNPKIRASFFRPHVAELKVK